MTKKQKDKVLALLCDVPADKLNVVAEAMANETLEELTTDQILKPVTWHTAHEKQPVWFRRRRGDTSSKLCEGIVSSFGHKNLTIHHLGTNETCVRPFGEVYFRKVEGPPTLVAYRK